MIWLLDTNVVTEATKPDPDLNCQAWLDARIGRCALCVMTRVADSPQFCPPSAMLRRKGYGGRVRCPHRATELGKHEIGNESDWRSATGGGSRFLGRDYSPIGGGDEGPRAGLCCGP